MEIKKLVDEAPVDSLDIEKMAKIHCIIRFSDAN